MHFKNIWRWAWWYMFVIPALGRLRKEGQEFRASLGHTERETLSQNKTKQQ
jgi:hypothetical protein